MTLPIHLIPSVSPVREAVHLAAFPGPIVVCDCYVADIEAGDDVPGGYKRGRILNIDHHADTPRMRGQISSANLALEHLDACGPTRGDAAIVINHTDCDSILSSGIMSGRLESNPIYGAAAIAADHTGSADPIADLLQALNRERDVELSFRSLAALLEGRPLEPIARHALDDRHRMRARAPEAVALGQMHMEGPIAWGEFAETMDGEFFPALLPDAMVSLAIAPHADLLPGRLEMKLRLGVAAPAGFTLHGLLTDFDPGFGGRWNAGANRRPRDGAPAGSAIAPETYAAEVRRRVEAAIATETPPG